MKKADDTLVILSPAFPMHEQDDNWVPSQQLLVKSLKEHFPALNIVVLTLLYPQFRSDYTWNGVRVISFNGMERRKWRRLLLWRSVWRTLDDIRKNERLIGLLSFWCTETALIGRYYGRFYSIRHRCWICGQDARRENSWVRWVRPPAQELVAMSSFLRRTFQFSHGITPGAVIPNAIDERLFPANLTSEKDIDILAVGSLEPLKQYHLLVEVVASLQSGMPAIRAIHCGGGSQKEELESLIREKGLCNNLSLAGEKPHSQVLRLMQRSKILLHTSSYEGFSTVCLEALYAGAHVISFCDPEEDRVPQWHIVRTPEEMMTKAREILQNADTLYAPVLLHSMDDTAYAIRALFEQESRLRDNIGGSPLSGQAGRP